MDPKHIVILAFQLSIVCTVLGFGLHATRTDLLYLWQRPKLLVRSLFAVMVVMPVVAVVIWVSAKAGVASATTHVDARSR